MKERELIVVYNASSGLFGTVTDFAHKILSPTTYQCRLCALTYGDFSMKKEWKSFIENFPVKTTFLHKNEFLDRYKIKMALPAIFIQSEEGIKTLISRQEIERCQDIEELKLLLVQKYENYAQYHHSDL